MELLKVLAMPFQMGSLLFVAASSLLLGWLLSMSEGQPMLLILALFAIWLLLVWQINYALRLIDDAANGVRESAAATGEMMADAYLDPRAWIHPLLAVALAAAHVLLGWPLAPTLGLAVVLLPASLGACTITGHALDAFNPLTIWRVIRGLGIWYAVLVGFIGLCAVAGVVLARAMHPGFLMVAVLQLLLLLVYAAIGGALYERRFELGFDPRNSPERVAERIEAERVARRQHVLDGMYNDLRVREHQRAIAKARDWLTNAQPSERLGDVNAILTAQRSWTEVRDHALLLQGLIPVLIELKQPGPACTVAEAGLALAPEFRTRTEAETTALVGYAIETGRKRTAARLLDNFLRRADAGFEPGPALAALRARLAPPA